MINKIADEDVRILASLSAAIAPDYKVADDDPWLGSPFEWILRVPSRTKGAIGESLVAGWAAAKGFDVTRSHNSDADRIINGQRIEIKLSTLWKNGVVLPNGQVHRSRPTVKPDATEIVSLIEANLPD